MKEILITTLARITAPTVVYNITAAPYPIYVANGIITHNKVTCTDIGVPDGTCVATNENSNITVTWTNGNSTDVIYVQLSCDNFSTVAGTYGAFGPNVTTSDVIAYSSNVGTPTVYARVFHYNTTTQLSSSYASVNLAIVGQTPGFCSTACLLPGTLILLADGVVQEIQNLKVGDMLASANIYGMSLDYDEGLQFQAPTLSYTPTETTIDSIQQFTKETYLDINEGLIQMSLDHINLVHRDGVWQFLRGHELQTGDIFALTEEHI